MEHENEVKILKNRIDELEKQHMDMVDKLKDKIECPVCMEIPRKGPLPVCPNGHFVCPQCKKESCPTCRSNMGNNKSILAGTIIDNIEHKCKFEDCDESFRLPDLDKHEETCPHRIVSCPHPSCNMKVSLSKLRSHLLDKSSCQNNNCLVNLTNNDDYKNSYEITRDFERPSITWGLKIFDFEDMEFVFYPQKHEGRFYFVIVMLGSDLQCSKYRVELELHEYSCNDSSDGKGISFKFCGNPTSIDFEKNKLDSFGISEKSMKRLMDKSKDNTATFSLTVSLFNL